MRQICKELEISRKREEELARLNAGSGQAIYLHARESQITTWDRVRRELIEDGYGVFPLKPEPVDNEPKKMRQRAARRVSIMQNCDAVMLVGTEDSEALEGDLPSIGHFERFQAIAHSDRLLPCCVIDTAGMLKQDPMLRQIAANIRVDWIDASASPWTPQVQKWLNGAAQ